jgi:2-C-methyl-D-erythritol 4-phosphate cytidylyltransferase
MTAQTPANPPQDTMPDVGVILCGAGASTRFAAEVPKPFVQLAGEPVFLHSLTRFSTLSVVRQIVFAVPEAWVARIEDEYRTALADLKTTVIIAGGVVRSDTVRLALDRLEAGCAWVAIHDAARPLVSRRLILEVLAQARHVGAAIPALPVGETVKQATADRRVAATLDRRELYLAQTPQIFRRELLARAFERQALAGEPVTDDAQLVERLGEPVAIVPGEPANFKITRMADLALAEAHLAAARNVE